jgi:hypothetical protein
VFSALTAHPTCIRSFLNCSAELGISWRAVNIPPQPMKLFCFLSLSLLCLSLASSLPVNVKKLVGTAALLVSTVLPSASAYTALPLPQNPSVPSTNSLNPPETIEKPYKYVPTNAWPTPTPNDMKYNLKMYQLQQKYQELYAEVMSKAADGKGRLEELKANGMGDILSFTLIAVDGDIAEMSRGGDSDGFELKALLDFRKTLIVAKNVVA